MQKYKTCHPCDIVGEWYSVKDVEKKLVEFDITGKDRFTDIDFLKIKEQTEDDVKKMFGIKVDKKGDKL